MATAKKSTPSIPTRSYVALVPIEHDSEPVATGEQFELTDQQAGPLLACRAVEPASSTAAESAAD